MTNILYLGIEVPPHYQNKKVTHCPLIRIVPKSHNDSDICQAFQNFKKYTHIIFTSRNAVSTFFSLAKTFNVSFWEISDKTMVSVGQRTSEKLLEFGIKADLTALEEHAEGIVKTISELTLTNSYFFLPQSSLARSVIADWLKAQNIIYLSCVIYETVINFPRSLPDLGAFDEIVFTSPSVVDAFVSVFGELPKDKILSCIGPITQKRLQLHLNRS